MWWKLLQPFIGPVFSALKKIAIPFMAYFKGRSDAAKDIEIKSRRAEDAVIEKGRKAGRDASTSGKLRDRYFRD